VKRLGVAIDLGTTHTLAFVAGSGIVLREPSRVLIKERRGEFRTVEPLKDGVVADLSATVQLLRETLRRVMGRRWLVPAPLLVICLPAGVSGVERRALEEVCSRSGVWKTRILSEPYAAALGEGLPVDKPIGSMLVDIGGGTCEAEIFSMGRRVCSRSETLGGRQLDSAVADMLLEKHNICVSRDTAEDLKINLGSAIPMKYPRSMRISGLSDTTGETVWVEVDSGEIQACLEGHIRRIVRLVRRTIEDAPTELACDILNRGMTLAGGTAQLPGLAAAIFDETGVRAVLAERPREAVVLGAGQVAELWSKGQLKE
jgi:rod shape-determining protein MreB